MKRLALVILLAAGCGGAGRTEPRASHPTPTQPPGQTTCPDRVLRDGGARGGACLDPKVLGEATVASCGAYLMSQGWVRDPAAEPALEQQLGTDLDCYSAPR